MHSDSKEFQESVFISMRNPKKVDRTCDTHGDYIASIFTVGTRLQEMPCPVCFDIRRKKDEEIERERMAEEHRQIRIAAEQRRLEEKTGSANIPKRFQGKTFTDYIVSNPAQQKALDDCMSYAHNFADNLSAGRCLILSGNVGTGKTHLGAAITDYIVRETEYTAIFRSLFSILQAIKNSYSAESNITEAEIFEILTKPDLLVIDEIGATKTSEFELATLFAIINIRYEKQLPTIVITNLEAKELKETIGDRCVDRLREGGGRAIMFNWESKRRSV